MRVFAFVACLALAGFTAWYFLYRTDGPSAPELTQNLRSAVTGLVDSEVTVQDCQLMIDVDKVNADQTHFTQALLKADLRLFDFANIRILPTKQNQAILIMQRRPISPLLIAQAERIVALLPADLPAKPGTLAQQDAVGNRLTTQFGTLDDVKAMLSDPTRSLTVSMQSRQILKDGETSSDLSPHPDAPAFFDFTEQVKAQSQPMTFHMTRFFRGIEPQRTELLAGAVTMPDKLQFQVISTDVAEALAEMLFLYVNSHCRV